MKTLRQQKILDIIESEAVETQETLCEKLKSGGYDVTQATVSRDIKELRLVKTLSPGGVYRYTQAGAGDTGLTARLRTIFRECVTSCDIAGNIVVLKTLPGLASAACSAIDAMKISGLIGTIAGDDTAFLALKTYEDARGLTDIIMSILRS